MGRRKLRRRRGRARLVREIGAGPVAGGTGGAARHAAGAAQAKALAPVARAGEALVRGPAAIRDLWRAHAGRTGGCALASGDDPHATLIAPPRSDQARETGLEPARRIRADHAGGRNGPGRPVAARLSGRSRLNADALE